MRRVRLAVGLALALVGITLLVALVSPTTRDTGTNARVKVSGHEVVIPHTRTRCQRETVPADTDRARVFANARGPAGPVTLLVRKSSGGRAVARGRIASIRSRGQITVQLRPRTTRDIRDAQVCFDNNGVRSVLMAGNQTPPIGAGNLRQEFPPDDVRIDYSRGGERAWWRLAPAIADRFALLKADVVDPFWLYGLAVVVAAAWAGALLTLRRSLRS